jgi:hypothetical protein
MYPRGLFERGREHPVEEDALRHRAVPLRNAVDDDPGYGPDVERVRKRWKLRRLDGGGADPRRGECGSVRQQHGRRAMGSGGGDEDVDREVALEPGEALERLGRERRRPLAGLEHGTEER